MPEYTVVSSISNSYATSDVGGRKVVRDLDDNMHCCWIDSNDVFYSKSADDGATWDAPEMVSDGQNSYYPSICVDSNGSIHVVWNGYISGESSNRIRYRKRTDSWQTIVEFPTFGGHAGHQRYPVIAVDGDDYIHVLWLDDTADLVNYRKYTDSWQPPETATPGCYCGPSMAVDLDGNIHIVYTNKTASQPGDYQILYRKNTGGSWSSEIELTDIDENQRYPCITVDRYNYVHVVWVGRTAVSGYTQVRYKKYTTSWQAIEEVTTGSYHQSCASVSVDGAGNIYVIFRGGTPAFPAYYPQILCRRNTGSWQAIEYITIPDPLYPSQQRDYPSAVSSLFPVFVELRPNIPHAGWAGVYTEYRSYNNVFVRYYAASDLEWLAPDDFLALSRTFLTTREIVGSSIELEEPVLIDRVPSFWFLHSMSGIPGSSTIPPTDTPTLYKVPFSGLPVTLNLYFGEATQKYHSFTFDENADWYALWDDVFQQEKCWAYDQHNKHLAILAKSQKAVHVYDLNFEVEDIIYSLQADEFANAVGLAFSDGRIDVFIPTVQYSTVKHNCYFLFDLIERESGGYLPYVYSFNIDGTPIAGPVLYSKAAVGSQTYFGEFTVVSPVVLSKSALENPVFIPAWSKLAFVEDQYAKSKTFLDDEDFIASECALRIWGLEGCHSKSHLNALNPDYHPRSKTSFADPYEWGVQSRVTAIGDYLLVGLMSTIRFYKNLEDPEAALYLVLFDRNTRKCIWSKTLKVSRVTGTTLYDGWLWEDIKAKSGFSHIFSEGKFEIELFDCFGAVRIALARYGTLDSSFTTKGVVWEEYDINLENPSNINLVKNTTSSLLYPTGFIFEVRDPYDFPIKTGEPKKDYLCYTMRCKADLTEEGIVELFQRDQADNYYVSAGSTPSYSSYAWLVALRDEPNCPFIKSATNLNIDFSSILSKALLRIANPSIGISGVIGQVDLHESLIKIIQSKTAFDDSGLVQSKVFMDDFLVKSSTDFIDNKNLAFTARYVVGTPNLSTEPTDDPGGPGIRSEIVAIVRIGDDNKAWHSMACTRWDACSPSRYSRLATVGDEAYYLVRQSLHNWVDPPPWYIAHYFLWKVNINTYLGSHRLPSILYHKGTGVWPDYDVWSADYLIELDHTPLGGSYEGQPLVYLYDRLFYIYNDSGVYGIGYIWLDPLIQGAYKLSEILPGFTKIVSIDTDGTYLYALGHKSDLEGLWLIKLNIGLTKLDELVIFKGKLHTGESYNAQFSFWDSINNQFVIGIAPIAGRRDVAYGYGAIVYSPVDGSIKWWKNFNPSGLAVHTLPGLNTTYFQRKRDGTIGMYTKHGDYMGVDLDVSDLAGFWRFDMRDACVKEIGIETSVQSKTCLVRSAEEQDNLFPDIPGPTQVPREQRFVV